MISDHYHPWIGGQGESPFAWSVLGGIALATERIQIATGVTCPTVRHHPALVAQAAATVAVMLPDRFHLGVGSGENLNEHIYGDKWPPAPVRIEMLAEAVEIIRTLWQGGMQDYYGRYYTVENARIFTLPEESLPIAIASEGQKSADLAGRIGDGLVNPGLHPEMVIQTFQDAGGHGRPCYIEFSACYAADEGEARRTAHAQWPVPAFPGELSRDLPTHTHFEELAGMMSEEQVAEKVVTGPDPQKYIDKIQRFMDIGYDHICIHQIGSDQQGFMQFAEEQILPEFGKVAPAPSRAEAV